MHPRRKYNPKDPLLSIRGTVKLLLLLLLRIEVQPPAVGKKTKVGINTEVGLNSRRCAGRTRREKDPPSGGWEKMSEKLLGDFGDKRLFDGK